MSLWFNFSPSGVNRASNLRQSILLSAYETPEIRSLFNRTLVNIGGKLQAEVQYEGVLGHVPKGVKQVFTRFECGDLYQEDEARFEFFTTKVSFFQFFFFFRILFILVSSLVFSCSQMGPKQN